ncbi:MAG TPA: hypothetical protein VKV18_12230 [Chthonomonas sp.]|uniref:hypothetical protein n=1 Tax=Chthonomonas sp. TaxID=2282153 RepID=UPI002B4B88DB|nr:hypothetical protein [Chthonomonas sp.]HLI49441.1 hypothetical protein [Chthonomonas sp.]
MSLPASALPIWAENSPVQPQPLPKSPAPRRPKLHRPLRLLVFGFTLLVAIEAGVVLDQKLFQPHPSALPLSVPSTGPNASVRLCTAEAKRQEGFVSVKGSLQNLSSRPLRHVQAVVELLNSKGLPLDVETAPIVLDPVLPHQNAPFHIVVEDSPQATSCRIRFRTLLGPMLD